MRLGYWCALVGIGATLAVVRGADSWWLMVSFAAVVVDFIWVQEPSKRAGPPIWRIKRECHPKFSSEPKP